MKGVIWHIYRNQQRGMIRGDDGAQIPFRKSALSGAEFYTPVFGPDGQLPGSGRLAW